MSGSFVRNLLGWFGIGDGQPQPPQPQPEEPYFAPSVTIPSSGKRPRMFIHYGFEEAVLRWMRQPIEWWEEWKQSIRGRATKEAAFDHEADTQDILELFECA